MSLFDLVEQALKKDEIEKQLERKVASEKVFLPYITFSREPGSGGKPIAREVAKKLGYKLYDKRLIEQTAAKMKMPAYLLSKVDERGRSGLVDMVQTLLNADYVSDEKYFRNLCQVTLHLAQKGGVVLVGRGSNFIAPSAYGLRVQIVAPYRVRVARAIEHEKVDFYTARDIIRDVSADRSVFVKQYFGKDIHAPKYYDLTLNTTFFDIKTAANLIIAAYKAKFPKARR
jgi:cytidylate kinase